MNRFNTACCLRATCPDQHCPGRISAILKQRCGGALIEDGYELEDPAVTLEDLALAGRRTAYAAAIFCAACFGWALVRFFS